MFMPADRCRVCIQDEHRDLLETLVCCVDSHGVSSRSPTAGASGLVIERAAADRLRLPCIGEIHVSGVAGKTRSCFRRSSSIQVVPPLFSCGC
jgi:hypothetical protein